MFESISRRGFLGLAPVVPFAFQTPSAAPPPVTPAPGAFPAQDPDLVKEIGRRLAREPGAREGARVGAPGAGARVVGLGIRRLGNGDRRGVARREPADRGIPDRQRRPADDLHGGDDGAARRSSRAGSRRSPASSGTAGRTASRCWRTPGTAAPAPAEVLKYLESLGDADPRYTDVPVSDADQAAIVGEYAFGTGATERLKVAKNARGILTIQRPGLLRAQPVAPGRARVHSGRRGSRPDPIRGRRRQSAGADRRGRAAGGRRRACPEPEADLSRLKVYSSGLSPGGVMRLTSIRPRAQRAPSSSPSWPCSCYRLAASPRAVGPADHRDPAEAGRGLHRADQEGDARRAHLDRAGRPHAGVGDGAVAAEVPRLRARRARAS